MLILSHRWRQNIQLMLNGSVNVLLTNLVCLFYDCGCNCEATAVFKCAI